MSLGRREAAGGLLAAVVVAVGLLTAPDRVLASLAGLSERPATFVAALGVVYLVRPLLAWPIVAVSFVVGYVLGPVAGLPVALVGAVLTSLLPFFAGGWFRTDEGLLGRLGAGGAAYVRATGPLRGVTAARLLPLPADAVSATAGVAGVPLWAYVLGTFVGEIPWTVAAVVLGGSARTITTAGLAGLEGPLLLATTACALLLLAGPIYRAVQSRGAAGSGDGLANDPSG